MNTIKYNPNYFDILDVDFNASLIDIKKSYKKLALEKHPDKINDFFATICFQELLEAYKCLRNYTTRNLYQNKLIIEGDLYSTHNIKKVKVTLYEMDDMMQSIYNDKNIYLKSTISNILGMVDNDKTYYSCYIDRYHNVVARKDYRNDIVTIYVKTLKL